MKQWLGSRAVESSAGRVTVYTLYLLRLTELLLQASLLHKEFQCLMMVWTPRLQKYKEHSRPLSDMLWWPYNTNTLSSLVRPKTTSEVCQKCQKKTCTLFSPKLAPMVRKDLPQFVAGALNSIMLTLICMSVTQPCASWKRCCFWTPNRGWPPLRHLTCPSSVSSEILKRRLKRCRMIRPWTTQTCRWTSGNVREGEQRGWFRIEAAFFNIL